MSKPHAVVLTGVLQVQQLQVKASIVDDADLPFTCTSGRLVAITACVACSFLASLLRHMHCICSMYQGGACFLAMVEGLRHDRHSLRNGHSRKDEGASQGDLCIASRPTQGLLDNSKVNKGWHMAGNAAEHGCIVQVVRQEVTASIQQKVAKALTAAKLKAVDGVLWGQKPSHKAGEQAAYSSLCHKLHMHCTYLQIYQACN